MVQALVAGREAADTHGTKTGSTTSTVPLMYTVGKTEKGGDKARSLFNGNAKHTQVRCGSSWAVSPLRTTQHAYH